MSKIRTRKRGKTYSYSFEIGNDPETGKRKMKEKGGFATAKEAYDAGTAAYTSWKHGNIGIVSTKIKFGEFFALWYKLKAETVRTNTKLMYDRIYRNYLKPYIGNKYMQDITPFDMDVMMNKLVGRGYAQRTIYSAYHLVHQIFKYAVYPSKIIQSAPTDFIKIPKVQKPKKEHIVISTATYNQILERLKEKPHLQITVTIAYYTGMRIGEIRGLTWDNISFEEKKLTIKSQMQGFVKHPYIGNTKTESGTRTVYLGDVLLNKLKDWKKRQAENKIKMGKAYQVVYMSLEDKTIKYLPTRDPAPEGYIKLDLVCTNPHGLPVNQHNINVYLSEFNCRLHDFRHTHATRLIECGVPPVEVAARLGHANVYITQNIYTHVTEKMSRHAADVADNML